MELDLAKDVKSSKERFYKYIDEKRKMRKNVRLLSKTGKLVMQDKEKEKSQKKVRLYQQDLQGSLVSGTRGKD